MITADQPSTLSMFIERDLAFYLLQLRQYSCSKDKRTKEMLRLPALSVMKKISENVVN
jgi:hypothetical protein